VSARYAADSTKHGARHTFASLMFAAGIEIEIVCAWLGHCSRP
jgi:site-specific recombinase XerD